MSLEELFTFENLYKAYQHCRITKQHKGEIIRFEANLSLNLSNLRKSIITKNYNLSAYKKFYIYEPKERPIEAPPFKDRIVIRCFCDVCLKPKIEKHLIYDNCACRKDKGTSFAIQRLHQFLKKEYFKENNNEIYFLKCDIRKYFPSIHHNILISLLREIGFSSDEMWMIKKLIQEQPNNLNRGLPLGNQSSQWFALLYLNKIDHYIKEQLKIKYYVRYMDDLILIHRDKQYLSKCRKDIEEMCNFRLELQLNNKTQIGMVKNGIDFLGYRHILNHKGKIIIKLRQSSKLRIKKHLKTVNKLYQKEIVDEEYLSQRINSFYNHVRKTKGDCRLKQEVFSYSRQK